MTFLQWRRFNFFDREQVKNPETNEVFTKLKDIDITSCASGHGMILFGDSDGRLFWMDRNLEVSGFKAYELRISHLFQLKQNNILVSIGHDEPGVNPLIKVWNMDKLDKTGNPTLTRISRALPGNNQASLVTALVVSENLSLMAIGFQDGSISLMRGDVTRERHSKSRLIHQDKNSVTGLAFKQTREGTVLFASTESSVVAFHITNKDCRREVLDLHGCPSGCAVLSDATQDHQFVIGRNEAVYFYLPNSRGPCLAFEGQKTRLQWFRSYLVVITKDNKTIPRAVSSQGMSKTMDIVTVYDINNKFIAFSAPIPEVVDVIVEWGSLYVLGGDRRLYLLQEKDTQTKLEMLFKKNLYMMAIELAKSQNYDVDGLIDIFTQYGDHLYNKGDHDGAISQYIRTIGKLEPSYVIRKFLDAQRIHNLTAYLQELHKESLANEDHTTLLLNCYTKLKDNSRLEEFIMTKDKELNFDVETAIKVCRQAGYFKHALFLAEKHNQHDWYLRIQLEDIKDYEKALNYISKLEFYEAMDNMKKYGKTLMVEKPQKTTELLKTLCTDYKPSDQPLIDDAMLRGEGVPTPAKRANAEEFIHIFVNNSSRLTEFLEHMIQVQPDSSSLIYNTLLELHLNAMSHTLDKSETRLELERKSMDLLQTGQSGESYLDIDHALVLCQVHNFSKGILYLYEKAKLYQQILHYHMDNDKYDQIIDTCKKYGAQDPNLWVQALSYFATKEKDCKPYMAEVLSQIDRRNLMPPLMVIQTLATNSTATLSVVKDYIVRRLQQENDQIAEDERLIQQYREETETKRREIEEMKSSAKIFQVSKCSICTHPLELPSVHFLCQHSYHQHCFESYAETDHECPACLPENRKVLDIIKAQEQNKDLDEEFHRQLEKAQDGFSVVADYFGRGVFNKVTLVDTIKSSPARKPLPMSMPQSQPLPSQAPPVRIAPLPQSTRSITTEPQSSPSSSSHKTPSSSGRSTPQMSGRTTPQGWVMPQNPSRDSPSHSPKVSTAPKTSSVVPKEPQYNPFTAPGIPSTRGGMPTSASIPKAATPPNPPPTKEYNPFINERGGLGTSKPADDEYNPFLNERGKVSQSDKKKGNNYDDAMNPFLGGRDSGSPVNPFETDSDTPGNPFGEELDDDDKNNPFFN